MERLVGPPALKQVLEFLGETGPGCGIAGGALAGLPDLRIALSHGGGRLQALLPRLLHAGRCLPPVRDSLADVPLVLARRMYFDDLVYDAATLHRLIAVFGASWPAPTTRLP